MPNIFEQEEVKLAPDTEFYIATVTAWNNDGYQLQFAGESSASTKYYKAASGATSPKVMVGSRVVVMKQSGTYVVLGIIDTPGTNYYFTSSSYELSSDASLSTVISRVNFLSRALVGRGVISIGN